jgi:hypothetical protein
METVRPHKHKETFDRGFFDREHLTESQREFIRACVLAAYESPCKIEKSFRFPKKRSRFSCLQKNKI